MEITLSRVHELFDYKDGNLIWKIATSPRVKVGNIAGYLGDCEYICIGVDGKQYKAHRLIYFYHNGYLPSSIDHIDGNRANNKIDNLRSATTSQNAMNQKISTKNSSGIKGVRWHKRDKKWYVQLSANSKRHSFGYYEDKELAEMVAIEATNKLHKEFSAYKGVLNGTA
jgi:hypothetical protein